MSHDAQRIRARLQADEAAVRAGLQGLADVLGTDGGAATSRDDALMAACRAVGRHLGIQLRGPARSSAASTTSPIAAVARASHVQTRAVELSGDWWRQDGGPLIAFRAADEAPVALLPTGPGRYVVHDVVAGTRRPLTASLARELGTHGIVLYRRFPDGPVRLRSLVGFALATTRGDLWTAVAVGIAASLLALATPWATGLIVGRLIPSGLRSELLDLAGGLVACALGTATFQFTRGIAVLRLEGRMNVEVQAAVFARLLMLDARFFRGYTTGDLAKRVLGIDAIRQLLTGTTVTSLVGAAFSVSSLALLFYYDWKLALVATGLMALLMGFNTLVGWLQFRGQFDLLEAEGQVSGLVLQLMRAVPKLRVAAAGPRAFARWAEEYAGQRRLAFGVRMWSVHASAVQAAFPVLMTATLVGFLGWRGLAIAPGDFLAFNTSLGQLMASVLSLAGTLTSLLLVGPTMQRVQPLLEAPTEVEGGRADPGVLQGAVRARGLSFRYGSDGPLVLGDVDFEARRGELVAIVGPSGCGKSTLLRLLLGFERPAAGAVLYDDQDLAHVDASAVRRQTGVVLQHGSVMPGDLLSNIVGNTLLTLDDAWEAARIAGLDAEIRALPMGMHTVISQGASTLSGGQRQRLLIARAVAGRPRVLFLDEATSALDNRVQEQVSQNLEALEVTRIVIAHRLSTIRRADRIYVMDEGHMVQIGTFEELVRQEGPFAELVRRQSASLQAPETQEGER